MLTSGAIKRQHCVAHDVFVSPQHHWYSLSYANDLLHELMYMVHRSTSATLMGQNTKSHNKCQCGHAGDANINPMGAFTCIKGLSCDMVISEWESVWYTFYCWTTGWHNKNPAQIWVFSIQSVTLDQYTTSLWGHYIALHGGQLNKDSKANSERERKRESCNRASVLCPTPFPVKWNKYISKSNQIENDSTALQMFAWKAKSQ